MKEIFSYFRGVGRREATVLLSSVFLMVFYLYQGNYRFFIVHFGDWFAAGADVLTYAQIYQCGAAFLLLGIIPLLLARFFIRDRVSDYGLRLGGLRFGLKFFFLSLPVLLPLLYLTAKQPEFQAEYPLAPLAGRGWSGFLLWELCYLVYYLGWEFFFRGYLQLGLLKRMGPFLSIMVQTLPSTIIHWGKPEGETLAAIAAGIAFGAVAIRTRSILYGLGVHWYVGILTDFFCLLHR